MSIASVFQGIGQIGSAVQAVFGRQNASQLSDCIGAAGIYGATGALAMYPQCAPYAAQMNVPIGTPNPRIPATAAVAPPPMITPPVPQALPGGSPYALPAPYTGTTLPVAYTPTMGMVPPLVNALPKIVQGGAAVLGAAGALTAAAKKALPVLNKGIALASGYIIAAGLVYTAAGQLVGRVRKRKRMNPLNYRAAKRAARRLCAVQDLTAAINKAIPARPARRSRRTYAFQRRKKTCR